MTLTVADLEQIIGQLCPARIALDEGRWIDIATPTTVEFVEGRGARLVTEAKIRWTVVGIDVPITVKGVEVFLEPKMVTREEKQLLAFALSIAELDLKFVPSLLDKGIGNKINSELSANAAALEWDFVRTLDWHFTLPKQLAPADSLHLQAKWGELKIGNDAMTIMASMDVDISRARELSSQ